MVSHVISHYRIIKKIGEGGMGQVFLAEDIRLHRNVALKVLLSDLTDDEQRVLRFQQEARAASGLNHPNILTIYDIGQVDGTYFIATEFVKGETLREWMGRGLLGFDEILSVFLQVASALSAAHEAGIIHRDIKPENIMLRPDGYVKVLDFGLAKLKAPHANTTLSRVVPLAYTEPGLIMGTPRYMSPEQVRGLDVDERSDIFSLGVLLYEMLTGTPPFNGDTISDIIAALLQTEPPLMTGEDGRPVSLNQVLERAMRKDVNERYQTVGEFASDLRSKSNDSVSINEADRPTLVIGSSAVAHSEEPIPGSITTPFHNPPITSPAPTVLTREKPVVGPLRKKRILIPGLVLILLMLSTTGVIVYKYLRQQSHSNAPSAPGIESKIGYTLFHSKRQKGKLSTANRVFSIPVVHSGDEIQVRLDAFVNGYIYLLYQIVDSNQFVTLSTVISMFPVKDGDYILETSHSIVIPLAVDDKPGVERVWIVWSVQPIPELKKSESGKPGYAINFLKEHSSLQIEEEKDEVNEMTILKTAGDILVFPLKFNHEAF